MVSALCKVEVAGAERVTDGKSKSEFPQPAIATAVAKGRSPGAGRERDRRSVRCFHEKRRRQPELAADMVGDAHRDGGEIANETASGAQRTELDGEPVTIALAPAAEDLDLVGSRDRPVPRELLVCRVRGELGVGAVGHGWLGDVLSC